jgi:hypothetical protein
VENHTTKSRRSRLTATAAKWRLSSDRKHPMFDAVACMSLAASPRVNSTAFAQRTRSRFRCENALSAAARAATTQYITAVVDDAVALMLLDKHCRTGLSTSADTTSCNI